METKLKFNSFRQKLKIVISITFISVLNIDLIELIINATSCAKPRYLKKKKKQIQIFCKNTTFHASQNDVKKVGNTLILDTIRHLLTYSVPSKSKE